MPLALLCCCRPAGCGLGPVPRWPCSPLRPQYERGERCIRLYKRHKTRIEKPKCRLYCAGDRARHQDQGRARGEVLQGGRQDGQHHHLRVGRDWQPHPAGGHHPPHQRVCISVERMSDTLHRTRRRAAQNWGVLHGILRSAKLQ